MSDGLPVGTEAPSIAAPLVAPDGTVETVPLASLYEDRAILLTFYTNDFTPDCIEEWCAFRDYDWFATDQRVDVVGVSKSRPSTHRTFIDRLDLSFPLYSDRDLAIAKAFDVTYRVFKLLPRARRSCFLIDTDGVIRYKWLAEHRIDPTRDTPNMHELKTAIEAELGPVEAENFGMDSI
jgi:peroxiredoxin